jgi:hypothetical protein
MVHGILICRSVYHQPGCWSFIRYSAEFPFTVGADSWSASIFHCAWEGATTALDATVVAAAVDPDCIIAIVTIELPGRGRK